jgi:hypothetical protein
MLSACVIFTATGHGQVSPVSVRVEQVLKSDTEKFTHTQKRSLKIAVTNASSEEKKALRVKYFFFGKDAGESEMLLLEKGDRTANVPARQTVIVETPTISRKSVEEHYDTKKSGQRGAKISRKVEASGQKIVGYGTQVFEGDKLLAEYFSEPSLKAKVAPKQ